MHLWHHPLLWLWLWLLKSNLRNFTWARNRVHLQYLAGTHLKNLLKHPKIKALCPGKQLIVLGSALWDVKHDNIWNCNTVKTEPRGVLKHFFLVCTVQVIQNLSMSLPYSRKALRSDANCGMVSCFLVDSASTSYPLADRLSLLQEGFPKDKTKAQKQH